MWLERKSAKTESTARRGSGSQPRGAAPTILRILTLALARRFWTRQQLRGARRRRGRGLQKRVQTISPMRRRPRASSPQLQ
eukprot:10699418-Heterocapsa_arctica.AAC.1